MCARVRVLGINYKPNTAYCILFSCLRKVIKFRCDDNREYRDAGGGGPTTVRSNFS